jgi:putative oxidoreductase
MRDLARLVMRLVVGGLLAGHGAQKLFGWFGGGGVEGTAGMMESLEMRPSRAWALLAGMSEFGGGVLMALGALNPLGPLGIMGAMSMATAKVHWGKPIWAGAGGAELPVTNIAAATALALVGPGRYSVDYMLGIRLPRWIALFGLAGIAMSIMRSMQPQPARPAQPAEQPGESQARDQLERAQTEAAQGVETEESLI